MECCCFWFRSELCYSNIDFTTIQTWNFCEISVTPAKFNTDFPLFNNKVSRCGFNLKETQLLTETEDLSAPSARAEQKQNKSENNYNERSDKFLCVRSVYKIGFMIAIGAGRVSRRNLIFCLRG